MNSLTISIFGSKIFLEIINEITLFNKYKINYYDDFELCIKDSEKKNLLAIFFINKKNKDFINFMKINNFPSILIFESPDLKNIISDKLQEVLNMPFAILELKKHIVSLIAKSEFGNNSVIKLNDYTIDKNERVIKRNSLTLKLSEKEINFLILFSKSKTPISKNFFLKNVWYYSSETETHTVETHIYRLRKKILLKFGDNNFIKNNNKGYYI